MKLWWLIDSDLANFGNNLWLGFEKVHEGESPGNNVSQIWQNRHQLEATITVAFSLFLVTTMVVKWLVALGGSIGTPHCWWGGRNLVPAVGFDFGPYVFVFNLYSNMWISVAMIWRGLIKKSQPLILIVKFEKRNELQTYSVSYFSYAFSSFSIDWIKLYNWVLIELTVQREMH